MKVTGPHPTPVTELIRLEHVRVEAGARRLLEVSELGVAAGERVAIVGPNGAGKSTLLRLLSGMATASQGRIHVLGRELGPQAAALSRAQWRALRSEVGVVMQGLHLVPRLSARDNVLIGALARLRGRAAWPSWLRLYPDALQVEADAALAALGLADRADTRADRLSGGERQKVSLARLRLQRARLVLADEPTSALDPSAKTQVCAALRAATAAPGQALVTVLHDLDLLPALATRVLGMAQGRIQWDLPLHAVDGDLLDALYDRPPNPVAAAVSSRQSIDRSAVAARSNHPPHCTRSAV